MKWKSNFGRLYLPCRMLLYMVLVSGDKCKQYELRSVALIRPTVKVKFKINGVELSITQIIRKGIEHENIILEELEKESRKIYEEIFGKDILDVMIKLNYNE